MGTEPQPASVADVVRRAVEACDPSGEDDDVLRLAARAEWRGDPPASVVAWLGDRGVEP